MTPLLPFLLFSFNYYYLNVLAFILLLILIIHNIMVPSFDYSCLLVHCSLCLCWMCSFPPPQFFYDIFGENITLLNCLLLIQKLWTILIGSIVNKVIFVYYTLFPQEIDFVVLCSLTKLQPKHQTKHLINGLSIWYVQMDNRLWLFHMIEL